MAKNSLANLPYILDGSNVITQSNSCLLFLGTKLGIDKPDCMIYNHQVNARSGSGARRTVAHAARRRTARAHTDPLLLGCLLVRCRRPLTR